MTDKQVDSSVGAVPPLPATGGAALKTKVTFGPATDDEMNKIAQIRAVSPPWKDRGESEAEALESLTKLRPYTHTARVDGQVVGYITIERDGPVPGAAYLRNVVVKPELRNQGLGAVVLEHGVSVARDMNRKTVALRVDPSSASVSFFRRYGFTTVATVVSKKSGKLRLLMSREL